MKMTKKRNKFFLRRKEWIRVQDESWELATQIRNQSLVELEKPIPHGWVANWKLRPDIERRKDAWVFKKVLDLVNVTAWSRNKDFRYKNRKSKTYQTHLPGKKSISSVVYEKLHPSVQKHFVYDYYNSNHFRKLYYCTITYEFVVEIKRDYKTHYREHDEILEQLYSEANDKLDKLRYQKRTLTDWNYNTPKWYRKCINKGARRGDKINLKSISKHYSGEQDDFIDNFENELKLKTDWW